MSRTTRKGPWAVIDDRFETGSADAFVTAAGRRLIGSGCGSIVLHAMYNVLLRSYAVFVLSHVLSDLCLGIGTGV